ncbi:MAG: hypothetical protein JW779_06590 [Candidatus Thorarchaeota archaeon]|nr:hypothetical protein [Candidatus Thorarchaeota archaeon]
MNDENRIPDKRPILFELFCPICGGSVYAIDEEVAYIGRLEVGLHPEGFTITKLECVLCRETFQVKGIGLKYEQSIADELGWPFPTEIEDGPSAIPPHVEKRMRLREQGSDSHDLSIDDFYADNFDRYPYPLEKDVLRYLLRRKCRFIHDMNAICEITVHIGEGSHLARILGLSSQFGLEREWLSEKISAENFSVGDIIESSQKQPGGKTVRIYFILHKDEFVPIASQKK